MKCTNPQKIWINQKTGVYQYKFDKYCVEDKYIIIPCKKCAACQENYKSELALRAIHELAYTEESMFITLTVAPEHMEEVFPGSNLRHRPFQLFMKRFRTYLTRKYGDKAPKIRYLMCGEYGAEKNRPHYHAIIFGYRFKDMYQWFDRGRDNSKFKLFRSFELEKLWKFGFSRIGNVSIESVKYLAKYVVKKYDELEERYVETTGEILKRPYIVYPRGREKGGLGYLYFLHNCEQMFARGFFINKNGMKQPIPRYYKRKFAELFPAEYREWTRKNEERLEAEFEEKCMFGEYKELYVNALDVLMSDFVAIKDHKQALEIWNCPDSLTSTQKKWYKRQARFITLCNVWEYEKEKAKARERDIRQRNDNKDARNRMYGGALL